MGIPLVTRGALVRLGILFGVLLLLLAGAWIWMLHMPGRSFAGTPPPLTSEERAIATELKSDVTALAEGIGRRSLLLGDSLRRAEDRVAGALAAATGRPVTREEFTDPVGRAANLVVTVPGREEEVVVVGAHYDTVPETPGANDNASGVAALLALARRLSGETRRYALRFVAFANEEPPFFGTERMGSAVHARGARDRGERIRAMIVLETIGCFDDREGSQRYPFPFSLAYPSRGNFIGFVGNLGSRALVRRVVGSFRRVATIPSEGGALPAWIPGVDWSDHRWFFEAGWPALMVTDTAPYRYPHYHRSTDTPEKLDYERMARVVSGLLPVLRELAGS